MDPTKNCKQPDSNVDPSSGDGAAPDWRGGHLQMTRARNAADICRMISFFKRETPDRSEREALRVEGRFYNQATSGGDYVRRVADYIKKIPENSGILQGDLTSQMGQQGDPGKDALLAWLLSHANTTVPTQQQSQQQQPPAGPLTDGSTSSIPPQHQPLPGPLTDGSSSTPPQQQPQQQLSGPNEHLMKPEHLLREELLALLKNMHVIRNMAVWTRSSKYK